MSKTRNASRDDSPAGNRGSFLRAIEAAPIVNSAAASSNRAVQDRADVMTPGSIDNAVR